MSDVRNAILLLGGSGPLTEELKSKAKALGLEDRVIFVGKIPEADLAIYFHSCDIFCFPSVDTTEAFGYAQIEAMLSEKPVICCDLKNGVNYVSQQRITGLTVPPRDPSSLTKAIQELVDDEDLRKRLGRQAKERALSEFTLETMSRGVLKVYETALKSHQRS